MARLNLSARGLNKTYNISGHAAYAMDDKTKLATMALTTLFGEDKFYGDNSAELISLAARLCQRGDGLYVAKLAVWARTQGNLRTVSHVLAAVVAHECSGEGFVRPMVRTIATQRGDDGTEMLAAHAALYGTKVRWPHALQRGVRDALEQMDAYQIAKYQSAHREFKMRDTLRICHPVARSVEAAEAMDACVARTLAVPKGWESELSQRGNTAEVWNELVSEGRLGYMAMLRNLRNVIASGADVAPVLGMLGNPSAVRRSRQLPFRFYSAWRELKAAGLLTTRVTRALDQALALSCDNVEPLHGRTAVLVDTSGSMGFCLSGRSKVSCRDTAAVLAALLAHISDDAWVCRFDTTASPLAFTGTSVLADIESVPASGGGTNMAAGFDCLMESGFDADRVVVLSDNEVNGHSWMTKDFGYKTIQSKLDEYRAKVGHDVWCHAIDLQGYGTQQFMGAMVNVMGGWSEQVLRFVALAEQGLGGLVDEVESLAL
jgi:hypothetical protein